MDSFASGMETKRPIHAFQARFKDVEKLMQSRRESATETAANIIVGMAVNQCLTMLIFGTTAGQTFGIVLIFTGASAARQYLARRWFNRRRIRQD